MHEPFGCCVQVFNLSPSHILPVGGIPPSHVQPLDDEDDEPPEVHEPFAAPQCGVGEFQQYVQGGGPQSCLELGSLAGGTTPPG